MAEFVTHDVKRFILSRPRNFDFVPGQGVKIVVDEPKWRKEDDHPFTPTSLRDDRVLELIIKRYRRLFWSWRIRCLSDFRGRIMEKIKMDQKLIKRIVAMENSLRPLIMKT